MDDVPCGAELLSEGEAPVRQSMGVMEEQNLGHKGQSLVELDATPSARRTLTEKHR